jgi:hypothetical protein
MPERICSVDGCTRSAWARGWCGAHYTRWQKHGSPTAGRTPNGEQRICAVDGCAKPAISRGWCQKHYTRWARHGDPRGARGTCTICGCEFWGRRTDSMSCGPKCEKQLWYRAEVQRQQARPTCSVGGCVDASVVRGWCEAHYARWQRYGDPLGLRRTCIVCDAPFYVGAGGQVACGSAACAREIQRRGGDKRRALKTGAFVERIFRVKVFERDGWRCHLCGKKVRRDVRPRHPLAPSLDHVIPLSRGGLHEYTNVRCAHLRCNCGKNNRAMNEQLLLV